MTHIKPEHTWAGVRYEKGEEKDNLLNAQSAFFLPFISLLHNGTFHAYIPAAVQQSSEASLAIEALGHSGRLLASDPFESLTHFLP